MSEFTRSLNKKIKSLTKDQLINLSVNCGFNEIERKLFVLKYIEKKDHNTLERTFFYTKSGIKYKMLEIKKKINTVLFRDGNDL